MATTINAGRVRFVSRGTYNNSTQYYLFDLVDYNGSSYIAKENTLGNLPKNTQYWQLIAEKGNTGNDGQTGPVGPTGNGIASITKTGTSGLVDTYTITYTNGNTTTFTVTNGEDGEVTETELNVLRQKLEDQQKVISQLPQVEGQGTEVTLENTIEAQFTIFDVEGNSTQETTEGRNMLDINKVSAVVRGTLNNGVITSDTSTEATTMNVTPYFPNISVSNGDKIYLSCDIKLNSGSTGGVGALNDGVNTGYSAILAPTLSTTYQRYQTSFTYTADTNINKMLIQIRSLVGSVTIKDIMISKSSSSEFEKYTNGASPNPNYEQPIYSAGDNGSINEKIQTRNLFDKNEIVENYRLISNGTLYADNSYVTSDYIKILSNTKYVFNSFSGSECICEYDKNKNNIGRTIMSSGSSVTTTSNTAYVRISIWKSKLDVFQFELGSTATPYVPHKEQDYSIFVQQPFRSIGDVRDLFFKNVKGSKYYNEDLEENKWYERHYIGEVVLNGAEEWVRHNNSRQLYYISILNLDMIKPSENSKIMNGMSNYFKPIAYYKDGVEDIFGTENGIAINVGDDRLYFGAKKISSVTDLVSWKEWLSTHNVVVQYLLAEPLDLPCTETQIQQLENLPSTYKDFTIIQSQDETPAYLEVSGIYDLNKLINN